MACKRECVADGDVDETCGKRVCVDQQEDEKRKQEEKERRMRMFSGEKEAELQREEEKELEAVMKACKTWEEREAARVRMFEERQERRSKQVFEQEMESLFSGFGGLEITLETYLCEFVEDTYDNDDSDDDSDSNSNDTDEEDCSAVTASVARRKADVSVQNEKRISKRFNDCLVKLNGMPERFKALLPCFHFVFDAWKAARALAITFSNFFPENSFKFAAAACLDDLTRLVQVFRDNKAVTDDRIFEKFLVDMPDDHNNWIHNINSLVRVLDPANTLAFNMNQLHTPSKCSD